MNQDYTAIKTVLIVDDDATNRRAYTEMLQIHDIQVISARDGLEAVEKYKKHSHEIHLVILDVMMPRMNGSDALAAIRTINPHCCCLIVTGYIDAEPLASIIAQGVSGILRKPFGMREMLDWVHKVFTENKCKTLSPQGDH